MSSLATVEAEFIVHPAFAFFRGDSAGSVAAVGRGGLAGGVRRRRWGRRRWRGRSISGFPWGTLGVPGLAPFALDLVLPLPISSIESEDAFLHGREATHDGGVHPSEVVPEASVETEFKTTAKSGFVPLELVGKGVEAHDVTIYSV